MDHTQAIELIQAAPFEANGWDGLLSATSDAAGAWAGQLLLVSPEGRILFHAHQHVDIAAVQQFERLHVEDPLANPRSRVVQRRPLTVYGDDDFMSAEDRRRNPIYVDFFSRFDGQFAALGLAASDRHSRLLVAGLRHERVGHIDRPDRERLGALLPHVAAAMNLQRALELHATEAAARSLACLATPAFLLNRWGAVVAMNPQAEAEAVHGGIVTVAAGRLRACVAASNARLQRAVERALAWHDRAQAGPGASSILVSGGGRAVVAEVSPLPRGSMETGLEAAAIVALPRSARSSENAVDLLRQCYPLSLAEAEVALVISKGRPLIDVAEDRGVQVHTVKNQLKAIFFKMAVRSQAELAHVVTELLGATD